ncbi:MAG: DUF4242 domain-containing protein [Proteobacteria bacterium]|nr:DUF4242 domain-containing protein [Pseudomonadota bacterium]MCK4867194.1 DUF4242 domain-containing protein [Alphaproteobacteria bacterium]
MARVIVERTFGGPADMAELEALEKTASWCLDTYRITPLASFLSRDGRRLICTYEAPDTEAVRKANQTAGLPFDSIWTATIFNEK